ncbi:MAG TPA: type II toxin-antitoxin system HipA family toxin [Caulobacteraceae bacterium]|nr:type II toxin-antitoxin system HipA family toxin [Caulobacteraceae bacterium]
MTSDLAAPGEAFVWIWLPGATQPVVAGRLARSGPAYVFNYGQSYLALKGAIPIYAPELPLRRGVITPAPPLAMAGCLRDGAPDAWGRRVIINRLTGLKGEAAQAAQFDELTFLLASGSERAGALDFQASPTAYRARLEAEATLEELLDAAGRVERGEPIPQELQRALFHGSSIGGARPKALIGADGRRFIAKFSAANDTYPVVKAEFIAMRLAARAGLAVAPVELVSAAGKDVLLVERFDREPAQEEGKGDGWRRRAMVSALTLFGLDEMQARYASYADLADLVRARFTSPRATLHELFGRIVFNVLSGNTDDHARNHAAFWDGAALTLTPAYDLCPQARTGREASQAMLIQGEDRRSQLAACQAAATRYHLSGAEARAVIDAQVASIREGWAEACDAARLGPVERRFLWGRQFLNDYAFDGYGPG